MNPINELFDRMDRWRHLPNYQLERRADLLFSLYLPSALKAKLGFSIRPDMIPEFPVRRGTISPNAKGDRNRSYKIDYLALSADGRRAVFVELKTEGRSRRSEQDEYLARAKDVGLAALLEGLLSIFRATNSKPKYFCLLEMLARMDLLEIPPLVSEVMHRTNLHGITKASKGIKVVCPVEEHYIIYVQPNGTDANVISFDDFRGSVAMHEDEVANRFAQSLSEWSTVEAGRMTST